MQKEIARLGGDRTEAAALRRAPRPAAHLGLQCGAAPRASRDSALSRERGEGKRLQLFPAALQCVPERFAAEVQIGGCAATCVPHVLADPCSSASMRPSQTGAVNIFEKKVG